MKPTSFQSNITGSRPDPIITSSLDLQLRNWSKIRSKKGKKQSGCVIATDPKRRGLSQIKGEMCSQMGRFRSRWKADRTKSFLSVRGCRFSLCDRKSVKNITAKNGRQLLFSPKKKKKDNNFKKKRREKTKRKAMVFVVEGQDPVTPCFSVTDERTKTATALRFAYKITCTRTAQLNA